MNDNLPPLDKLLERLTNQQRQHWHKHREGARITGHEQTSHLVRAALARGDVDEALYAAIQAREDARTSPASQSESYDVIAQGTKADEALAAAISKLSALRAESDPSLNVRVLRTSMFGRAEPFTKAEAWAFLERAERRANPVPWERLHAGHDRSPLMAQGQVGEHATLSFRDERGVDHEFYAGPSTALGELWTWANLLTLHYNWPRSQAAWFLLTGEPPKLLPVSALIEGSSGGMLTSTVSVTVLAHCSEKSVLGIIKLAKRQLLGRRRGPMAEARHAMAEFVDGQRSLGGIRITWSELHSRWNAIAPPRWRMSHRRAMLDAYRKERGSSAAAVPPQAIVRVGSWRPATAVRRVTVGRKRRPASSARPKRPRSRSRSD